MSETNSYGLLPCPLCAGNACLITEELTIGGWSFAQCDLCMCKGPKGNAREAVSLWNCRATAEQAGSSEAQSYVEPDGCPTELAVLQRFWRAEQAGKVEEGECLTYEAAQEAFTAYFVKNYPGPTTIISDPRWHAPRLFRVAYRSFVGAAEAELSLRAKPTQPAATQMPVATVHSSDTPGHFAIITPSLPRGTKLYAAPVSPSREVEALAQRVYYAGADSLGRTIFFATEGEQFECLATGEASRIRTAFIRHGHVDVTADNLVAVLNGELDAPVQEKAP